MAPLTLPRSRALNSYLRNFTSPMDADRTADILEITLCYGIHCLAQLFPLQGITLEELQGITDYSAIKKKDFYVRSIARDGKRDRSMSNRHNPPLYKKPSHAWRKGDSLPSYVNTTKSMPRQVEESEALEQTDIAIAPSPAPAPSPSRPLDSIDLFKNLFGEHLVDVTWNVFTGIKYSKSSTDRDVQMIYRDVDQRKRKDRFSDLNDPKQSFEDFIRNYVARCVREYVDPADDVLLITQGESQATQAPERCLQHVDSKRDAAVDTKRGPRAELSNPQPLGRRQTASKIKPELQRKRDNLLRVRKTQTQIMKEKLARARLDEYEKQADNVQVNTRKKSSLDDITPGAAALEIADDFVKGPLLHSFTKFADGEDDDETGQSLSRRKDPLKEELYGTSAAGDSFIGCKTPVKSKKDESKRSRRKKVHNGWLGDYGPLHTRAIRPTWEHDLDDSDSDVAHSLKPKVTKASKKQYEWKFGTSDEEESGSERRSSRGNRNRSSLSSSNPASSDTSDPVFQWLKRKV